MPNEINDLALTWLTRLDQAGDNPALQAGLEAWLAQDPRHRGAFLRAEAAWRMLDRAAALRGGEPMIMFEPAGEAVPLRGRRRFLVGGGMAAAIAVATGSATLWWRSRIEVIETALGEVRTVPLSDGSRTTLNSASRVRVAMTGGVRTAVLEHGEAWFEVEKDRARPFVVEAGEMRIRAVGTAFAVRRSREGAFVEVTEGIVDIWSTALPAKHLRAPAGARVASDAAAGPSLVETSPEAIERSLAWRQGQLFFAGDTLESAVTQFNRYNAVPIIIADDRLRARRMIGRFRTNEPAAFARAAADMFGTSVEIAPDHIAIGAASR